MDEDIDIQSLLDRYEQMLLIGKNIYFDADEFAALADFYESEGDSEEANSLVELGLSMHPGNIELLLMKAKMLVLSEQYPEALSLLDSISDDSEIDHPLLKIECYLHLNENAEADKLINNTLQRELSASEFYYFITEVGYLFNDIDDFDRALSFLEESLKIEDTNVEALTDLAYAYEMKGDFQKAIDFNNILLDIDPYSFDGWVNIGKLYSMNEQFDKALDSFDFALTIHEKDLSVLKMKALTLFLNDNAEEAARIFEECVNESPNDEILYDSLMEAYEAMGNYDKMMQLLDQREAIFGQKGIMSKRASVFLSKNDYDTAKQIFSQIPADEQDTLDYYMLEGELAFYDNDYKRAESAYMKAALISEGNEEILDRLANISVAQGKYEQAVIYLREILELEPDFPTARARLAFVLFEIGLKEPFDEVVEQFSDNELRNLLATIMSTDSSDFSTFSRDMLLSRLNDARENRVLFKNIKY